MKNEGKIFESDFANSIPWFCYFHRLRDSAQSYNKSANTTFTWDNECDFFMFDSRHKNLYAIECKSTKYKAMSVESEDKKEDSKMIKQHQIRSLNKMSQYDGIISGFLLNFRDEKNDMQRTYFIDINNFITMMSTVNKKSFNEMDLILNNAYIVNGNKKRTRYYWHIDELISVINGESTTAVVLNKEE